MGHLFTRFDPALREQVAAIDWKAEHWRDNARGEVFAELEQQRSEAASHGLTPYYIRPMQGSTLTMQHAPYIVRPIWNHQRRMLELAFLPGHRAVDEHTPEAARYHVPPHIYAIALRHHRESILESLQAQHSGPIPGGVVRAKAVGAEAIRDHLREQNLEISLSFAAALFAAITKLERTTH